MSQSYKNSYGVIQNVPEILPQGPHRYDRLKLDPLKNNVFFMGSDELAKHLQEVDGLINQRRIYREKQAVDYVSDGKKL